MLEQTRAWLAQVTNISLDPDLKKELREVRDSAECVISSLELIKRIEHMANEMSVSLADKNPVFICILNGGLPFSAQLIRHFDFPLQMDYMHLTRYQGDLSGNEIRWIAKPQLDLKGRTVVLLDDILDSGISLETAKEFCRNEGAQQVVSAVLLKKQIDEELQIGSSDYIGFECPDRYVFGFGMDYKNYLRNLDGIYALKL